MKNTNPKQLRKELKDYLDLASTEPVRIVRRSGESFILVKEEQYQDLYNEIMSLQGQLLGVSQILSGKIGEYKIGDKTRLDRFKKKRK